MWPTNKKVDNRNIYGGGSVQAQFQFLELYLILLSSEFLVESSVSCGWTADTGQIL